MTGPKGALSVRVSDGVTDRHVTQSVSSLRWTKMVNAGHQSLSFRMVLPHRTFDDLGPQDRAYVYDDRTGRCLFDSYIENPTPVDGLGGQSFDISALGGVALANDEARPLVYLQRGVGDFVKSAASADSATIDQGAAASAPAFQRLRVQFNRGQLVATAANISGDNGILQRAGMSLGAIRVLTVSGKTDGGYRTTFYYNAGSIDIANGTAMQTGAVDNTYWAATDFPTGTTDTVALALRRTGSATNIADDETWTDFIDVLILGQRMDRYGTLLTGSAGLVSPAEVLASQVVEDLLGRLLTFCDPATAQVDVTEFGIDQLAFTDGAKAADVMSKLGLWESDYWWGIGASGPNGLHEFAYRRWAAEPRYVVSVKDGYRQTGSDVDLCNRILVSWTDSAGTTQTTTVTDADLITAGLIDASQVAALGSRVKDAEPITLPTGFGSAANATQIGTQALLDKIAPPRAGTVTVRRPIVDLLTGNTVMPWELEPGWPVLVREPGHAIRCTQVDYDDETVSAVLTLGTPPLTTEQRAARLSRAA